ncbi:hypothetical protein CVT24_010331 [Panaeolus cyanescens]|uniref:DUF6593 domain-containing protein n=1 Tax=Panaeolus cyanescens TaxID=181874 RepID=A0A409YQD7_9AGAR|nr:hypothetical protein CVT24_010331 [Panaeolus cyanescens]
MNTSTNPLFLGWGNSSSNDDWMKSTPPTFGALPTVAVMPCAMVFTFNMAEGSILNCSVTGTNTVSYFRVVTNSTTTTILRRSGEACATIEWYPRPVISGKGIPAQPTSQFLPISADRRRRGAMFQGKPYSWIPRGNAICLYDNDGSTSGEFAIITQNHTKATLTLPIPAFNAGFFEMSVVAAVLFLSGRNID